MDPMSPDHPGTTLDRDAAEVIHLAQDWTELSGHAPLAQVDAYWHAVRGTRLVPRRSDMDPRGIEGALSHAFIIERIASGHARVRIAGTHLADVMGMEVRGMPLSALFEPDARLVLGSALTTLFEGPSIQKFSLSSGARIGKPGLQAQMALYPLRSDAGDISRALGCLVTEGNIGRAPRRFEIGQVRRTRLTEDDQPIGRMPVFDTPAPAPVAEAAEPSTQFKATAVPWLRVVEDQ